MLITLLVQKVQFSIKLIHVCWLFLEGGLMMKFVMLSLGALALLCVSRVNATIISDYDKITAANAGWTVVYSGGYGTNFNYASVLDSIASGSKVALASSSNSVAATYDLFAGTSLDVLQTITAINTTIFADDAYWYRNNLSTGFAPVSDIYQCQADASGTSYCGLGQSPDANSDLRLSWHGGLDTAYGGWRSGDNIALNANNDWQRYVLVQTKVPEPSSLLLMGIGLAGLGFVRRRKRS